MRTDISEGSQDYGVNRLIAEHLYELGLAHGRQMLAHLAPEQTLVLIHPEDADTFGRGFLEVLGLERVEWRVLWQQVMELPQVGEASTVRMRFVSKPSFMPKKACLLQVFNAQLCRLRTQALVAIDAGVDLEALHVVSPWMPDSLWQQFCEELPGKRLETGISLTTDEQMMVLRERYATWIEAQARFKGIPQIVEAWMQGMEAMAP